MNAGCYTYASFRMRSGQDERSFHGEWLKWQQLKTAFRNLRIHWQNGLVVRPQVCRIRWKHGDLADHPRLTQQKHCVPLNKRHGHYFPTVRRTPGPLFSLSTTIQGAISARVKNYVRRTSIRPHPKALARPKPENNMLVNIFGSRTVRSPLRSSTPKVACPPSRRLNLETR